MGSVCAGNQPNANLLAEHGVSRLLEEEVTAAVRAVVRPPDSVVESEAEFAGELFEIFPIWRQLREIEHAPGIPCTCGDARLTQVSRPKLSHNAPVAATRHRGVVIAPSAWNVFADGCSGSVRRHSSVASEPR